MTIALTILDAALAIGVVVTIILQSSKAAGLGAIGGGPQTMFGQKKSKDEMLAKLTTYLAASWMGVTLLLNVLNRRIG